MGESSSEWEEQTFNEDGTLCCCLSRCHVSLPLPFFVAHTFLHSLFSWQGGYLEVMIRVDLLAMICGPSRLVFVDVFPCSSLNRVHQQHLNGHISNTLGKLIAGTVSSPLTKL